MLGKTAITGLSIGVTARWYSINTAKHGKTGCRPDNGAFNNTPSEDGKIEDHVIVAQRLVKRVTSLTEDDSEHLRARSVGRGGSDPWQ